MGFSLLSVFSHSLTRRPTRASGASVLGLWGRLWGGNTGPQRSSQMYSIPILQQRLALPSSTRCFKNMYNKSDEKYQFFTALIQKRALLSVLLTLVTFLLWDQVEGDTTRCFPSGTFRDSIGNCGGSILTSLKFCLLG